MSDSASYVCPVCGEHVCAVAVVDSTFIPRLNAHKATHTPASSTNQSTTPEEGKR